MDLHPSGMGNVTVKSAVFPASIVTKLLADIIEPLISDNLLWFNSIIAKKAIVKYVRICLSEYLFFIIH